MSTDRLRRAKAWMSRAARHLPIVGPLWNCRIDDHITATKRFTSDFVASTAPLWGGALVVLLTSNEYVSPLRALITTFERGELLIYCTAILGPIIYMSNRDLRDASTFPGKLSMSLVTFVAVFVCALVFALYRADVIANEALAFWLSVWAYGISLGLYYLTILYDTLRTTAGQALRREAADFVTAFNKRHQYENAN